LLDGPKPLSVLRAYGCFELGSVRAQLAPEPPDGDPKIVQRLAVETIVESALGLAGCREALEC